MTSLSYTIGSVFAGHLPRPDLGPDRHRTELFSRPRHLRRGSVYRETNGFLVGNRGTRLVRQRPREVTVLRAAYPLQTENRKPNWVSHGNEKAFKRARGAIEHADVGYAVLGGFHSHTGDDGAASLSRTDLDYVADELRRISRDRPADRVKWLEVVMALKRRQWSSSHEAGWATRRYRRKIGCTVALDANHGYDMTIGGDWGEGEAGGEPRTSGVVGTRGARLLLPWTQWEDLGRR